LKVEDKVYGLGPRWLEIDPGTLGFTRVNEEALLRGCCVERAAWSWHYGILGWQGYRCKDFFQISIAKAPARDKEGAAPAEVKEAPPAPSLPGDRRR